MQPGMQSVRLGSENHNQSAIANEYNIGSKLLPEN
jgi:hypothetical protein